MNPSPYLLLKRSTANALTAGAGAALARWADAWTKLAGHDINCTEASDAADALAATPAWRCRALDGGGAAWIAAPADIARHVERLLFDVDEMEVAGEQHPPSAIAAAVADEALEALLAALVDGLTGQNSQPAPAAPVPARLLRRGSGAVLCRVRFGERAIDCLLPAEALPASGPAPRSNAAPGLATLHQALAKVAVPLGVEVSRAELTLGYLRTLAVGDVLALPTRVDQSLRVTGPGGTTVCHAHLGAQAGFHAVQLIKAAQ